MRLRIEPGSKIAGEVGVPGDKSIAHRWLILASTAIGASSVDDLPPSLDVRSTARCLAAVAADARDALEGWLAGHPAGAEGDRFTFNNGEPRPRSTSVRLTGRGRAGLEVASTELDCGNSGTTMRLMAGVLASCAFTSVLTGDESLRSRPMDRIARPLERMGATVATTDGYPPLSIWGGRLRGTRHVMGVPSAQVKGAMLLAGLEAEGETTVLEPVPTRDHTERALAHLGAPLSVRTPGEVRVSAFRHEGFGARVPGDVSSAAYLVAAAALTGGEVTIERVGLNPSRTAFLAVMERMGIRTVTRITDTELGEPVGRLHVEPCDGIVGVTVAPDELPLVIDEVPVLAALAAHAAGESRFLGASELRVKESDRLAGLADGLRGLGGRADVQGTDLIVEGGGLRGGHASARGDHRMGMAWCVAGLGASGPVEVEGVEVAGVSFPGFLETLRALGARFGG